MLTAVRTFGNLPEASSPIGFPEMARSSSKVQRPAQDNVAPASPPDHGTTSSAGPDGYVFSNQIGHLLRRAYQRHLAIFQQNASDPNLTSIQFVTLCALRDRGP